MAQTIFPFFFCSVFHLDLKCLLNHRFSGAENVDVTDFIVTRMKCAAHTENESNEERERETTDSNDGSSMEEP